MREALKARVIAATEGSQLGAIIAAALKMEIPPPCFHGDASVTSDGFLMCSFTDRDGLHHMGAFVGSVADLERNLVGLSRHLSMTDQDRVELFELMVDWIAVDYRPPALRGLRMAA